MSAAENQRRNQDKTLGMNERISRRDFLNSTLLASGGLLMSGVTPLQLLGEADEWTGYGGVGDYSKSNGNTLEVLAAGHRIRDGKFERLPNDVVDTGEIFDCVVVGGGISGWLPRCSSCARAARIAPVWFWIIIPFSEAKPSAMSLWWMAIA